MLISEFWRIQLRVWVEKKKGIPSGGQAGAPLMSGRTSRGDLVGNVSDLEWLPHCGYRVRGCSPGMGPIGNERGRCEA